jgi:hypothetical protein
MEREEPKTSGTSWYPTFPLFSLLLNILSLLVWSRLPTHCTCRGLLLHLITLCDTLRHIKLGRTPLDEWSAWRRDLYLTTYDTPAGFEPAIPASEWPQIYALDRATTGIGCFKFYQKYDLFVENCRCPQPNKIFSLLTPLLLHPTGHEQDDKVYVWV